MHTRGTIPDMRARLRTVAFAVLFVCAFGSTLHAQATEVADATNGTIAAARTVTLCEVLDSPEKFNNKMIRVRALYETDFEKAVITSPFCSSPLPMTWVKFEKQWESRTTRGVRHALSSLKWGIQADVVFIGLLKTGGHFGHLDMYPFLIEVCKEETVRASGSFRPLPEQKKTQN